MERHPAKSLKTLAENMFVVCDVLPEEARILEEASIESIRFL